MEENPEDSPKAIPVDKEMEGSLLLTCKAWGYRGATREIFYKNIKGLNFSHLKGMLVTLEEKGLVRMEWIDFDRFFAYITPEGEEYLDKWLMALQLP